MATYSTLLAATPDELATAFPAWRRPLIAPVKRQGHNPFTGKPVTYDSWDPDPSAAAARFELTPPNVGVVPTGGNYDLYLEQRLDSRVRALPHACLKGFTEFHVEDLCSEFGVAPDGHPALFPPAARSGSTLVGIPAVAELAGLAADSVHERARSLAAREWFTTFETDEDDAASFLSGAARIARLGMATGRGLRPPRLASN